MKIVERINPDNEKFVITKKNVTTRFAEESSGPKIVFIPVMETNLKL